MSSPARLLAALASGHFVSGEQLARDSGVSRAAVWKQVRRLQGRGIPIDAVRGRGYRLHGGTPLLSVEGITAQLNLPVRTRLSRLEVLLEVDSTNTYLLDSASPAGCGACIAEWQTAGRGRRGRAWHAPFGSSLCFSLAYPFVQLPPGFGGLGLVAGIAVAEALHAEGYGGVALKWPNDLMVGPAKLGGLLVESRGEAGGTMRVVVGVGINWRLASGALNGQVDGEWTDLASLPAALSSRDSLIAHCLNALVMALDEFSHGGLAAFRERWAGLDTLSGKEVEVHSANERVRGRAEGIDDEGALRVRVGDSVRRFTSGEVSVRSST